MLLILLPSCLLWSQKCRFGDPIPLRHNDSLVVELGVFGAVLNDLADPRQGVCEVRLNFIHNAILDFEVSLVSPAGQEVKLIGPNSSINTSTLFGLWNIGFVPCALPASPDGSFQSRWDNQVNLFPASNYKGTYYPFEGCLEDFDRGPVNGTWKLKLKTFPTAIGIASRLVNFQITFCDELGRNCCFANAGKIAGPTALTGCQGGDTLLIRPRAQGQQTDSLEYGYTWLLAKNQILLERAQQFDLRSMPVGAYEVCGLSYDFLSTSALPLPDGTVRLDSLRAALKRVTPPFCGKIMDTCLLVTVLPPPDTGFLPLVICAGDTLRLEGNAFSAAGNYLFKQRSVAGCDSIVRLDLRVLPPVRTSLDTSICAGKAFRVGNSEYRVAGSYRDTLTAASGCDSIVSLNLSLIALPEKFDTVYICQGSAYLAGGNVLSKDGDYLVQLPATDGGCDTLLHLTLFTLSPRIVLGGLRDITCAQPSIILDAAASQPEGRLRFRWEGAGGIILGNQPTLEVSSPGRYVLQIVQEVRGTICAAQIPLTIKENYTKPQARITGIDTITCKNPVPELSGINDNPSSNAHFQWISPSRSLFPQDTARQFSVRTPGEHTLVMEDRGSGCRDTAKIDIALDTVAPTAQAGADTLLNCRTPDLLLSAGGAVLPGVRIAYQWMHLSGDTLGKGPSVLIEQPGTYFLEALNEVNGCKSTDVIIIGADFQRPQVSVRAPNFACGQDSLLAQAIVLPSTSAYRLEWQGDGVKVSSGQLRQMVYAPGVLTLVAENLRNGCTEQGRIIIGQAPCPPCLSSEIQDTLTCSRRELRLKVRLCKPCSTCQFTWTATGGGTVVRDAGTLNPVVSGGGTFNVVARDSTGLETSLTVTVPTDTLPPRADAGTDKTLTCVRKTVELGTKDSIPDIRFVYEWRDGAGMRLPEGDLPFIQAGFPGQYVLAKRSIKNGCTGLDTVAVALDTLRPRANAGPAFLLTCNTPQVSLDGRNSSAGFSLRYRWEASRGGNIIAGENSVAPLVNTAGWYKLSVTDTLNGCTASDSVQVSTAFDGPFLAAISDRVINCRDSVVRLEAKLPDNKPYSFCWRPSGAASDTSCRPGLVLDVRTAGNWIFELTDQATGCKSARSVRVGIDTVPPDFDAGRSDTLRCNRPEIVLSGLTALPAGQYAIAWTTTGGNILDSRNTLSPRIGSPAVYSASLQSLLNFCVASDSVRIVADTVRPIPDAGRDTALTCANKTIRLRGLPGMPVSSLKWSWTTTDGAILDDAGGLTPLIAAKGRYVFSVTNTRNGCTAEDTVEVLEKILPPKLLLNTPGPYILTCKKDTLNLDGNGSISPFGGPLQISWQAFGGGGFNQQIPGSITLRTSGRYRMVARDVATGCADSLEIQVTSDFVKPLISLLPYADLTCVRKTIALQVAIGGTGIRHVLNWTDPGGKQVETDSTTYLASAAGQYTLIVTNENTGCASTQKINIGEDRLPPLIRTGSIESLDCNTREVTIDAGPTLGRRLSFLWSALEGSLESPANGPLARTTSAGRYVVSATDGVNGCTARDTFSITEAGNYIDSVLFSITAPGCDRGGMLSVTKVAGGTAPFRFRLDSRLSDPAGNFVNIPPGTYQLEVSDIEGCSWAAAVEMAIPQRISVDLGPDRELFRGDSAILNAVARPLLSGIIYQWTGGTEIAPTDSANSFHTVRPLQTTTYQVLAKAPNGCTATDNVMLKVISDLPVYLPNAFSPNGDGQNDIFFVQTGSRVAQVMAFRIFNRWGSLLFEKTQFLPNDPAFGWDGMHLGKESPAGVYIFHAVLRMTDDREENIKGEVILLK